MSTQRAPSLLERFLGLFAEVRGGEGLSALLLTLNIFLILSSYYIMKPVREALILAAPGGAELKSYMSAGQTFLLLFTVPLYGWLASRLPRRRLLNGVTLFFVLCLVVFYVLGQARVPLGVPFFLWIGIFNVSLIAQFWSFANDLYTAEQGKRLFAIVAFGASAGAVFGATTVGRLIEYIGLYSSLLVAGVVLALSLVFTNWVDRRESSRRTSRATVMEAGGEVAVGDSDETLGKENPYRLVFGNRYLLSIALLILFLNWVNTTGEYILGRLVRESAVEAAQLAGHPAAAGGEAMAAHNQFVGNFIGKFYADFFGVVNVAGLVVQLLLVSRLIKYLGVRIALLILPVIALAGYALAAFFPILGMLRWTKTAENATDYSLMNTLKGVLFLPTTREQKYKAKQAIDTLFFRAGDVLSALLVFLGSTYLAFQTKHFALLNIVLVVIWMVLALRVGAGFLRLSRNEKGQSPT